MCGVWGDRRVSCVRAEGHWRRVDVVVVHHGARQDQLEQTGDAKKKRTQRDDEKMRKEKCHRTLM